MKAKIPFERRNPKGAAASKAEILRSSFGRCTSALNTASDWVVYVSCMKRFFSCEKKSMNSIVPNRKKIRNVIRVSLKMKTNR